MIKRPVVTPVQVIEAFNSGKSTADMARELMVPEASIYNLLVVAREAQRLFHDPDNPSTATLSESTLESYKRWHRLSFPEVQSVEDGGGVDDRGSGQKQKYKG